MLIPSAKGFCSLTRHVYVYIHMLWLIFLSKVIFVFVFFLFLGGGGGWGAMITYPNEVAASSRGFPRLSGTARAGNKRNRRKMGMSVERERGVTGRTGRGFFSPSHHSLRPHFP